MDPRSRKLLVAPIGGTILRLALPNVVVMVAQAAIGVIETYFVAKLGTDALAGIALVFPLQMLIVMISAGAMGGGILSAVARALGGGRDADANDLVWHAVAIALVFGAMTMVAGLVFGETIYAWMGGEGGSLRAALIYSNIVFAGAIPLWLYNSLAAVIRGSGNMFVPASVTGVGSVLLIPLSPVLIFGWGVLPAFGIAGGAAAVVIFYIIGSAIFVRYIWSGRGVLQPSLRPSPPNWASTRDILRIGAVSSIVSVSTNLIMAVTTGIAGVYGAAAVAGFGTGVRLEYLLVPLVFGLGTPVAAMVGTSIGAGDRKRALRAAWVGAAIAGAITETIGIAAALAPHALLSLFGNDATMNEVGAQYLRIVGPFYGFFGAGLALYFASQGAGRLGWALVAAILRVSIAVGGGLLAMRYGFGLQGVFLMLGTALAVYGIVNALAVALGSWFTDESPAADACIPQLVNKQA